jgi:hypothetical protein
MVEHKMALPQAVPHDSCSTDERTFLVVRFLSVNPFLRTGTRLRG